MDITSSLLQETVEHQIFILNKDEKEFLEQFKNSNVFLPSDIGFESNTLGKINHTFLGWVKTIAQELDTSISITYNHTRDDSLYRSAMWVFAPNGTGSEVEKFSITEYDKNGSLTGTGAEIVTTRDGETIKRYSEA